MKSFAGQHVWIIGASTGIGRSLAFELHQRGARLALSARSQDKLIELNKELGGGHHVLPLDVSDTDAFVQAGRDLQKVFERLDRVIFMAALYAPASLEAMNIAQAKQMVDVNFNGALNFVHAVLPILQKQKSGQLALCASVAGYRGLPGGQPYSATKAAVISLAESLCVEQPELDIKLINPGFVRTPLTDKNDFHMPMMIEPEDAAKAIADGLLTRTFEIHFPKRFTFIMKCLRVLPAWLYFVLGRKISL